MESFSFFRGCGGGGGGGGDAVFGLCENWVK